MLTPLELDIMKMVWRKSPITVRDVQIALRPRRNLAYTTVMTIMSRLYGKGFLTRTLQARAHLYEAAVPYTTVRDNVLEALIKNFFDGSRDNLVDFLNTNSRNGHTESPAPEPVTHSNLDETLL
jgi:predicted transcriptional regulator